MIRLGLAFSIFALSTCAVWAQDTISVPFKKQWVDCPRVGMTLDRTTHDLGPVREKEAAINPLKNRDITDFENSKINPAITLEALVEEGPDEDRWSSNDCAQLIGYVMDVKVGGIETCNCKTKDPAYRDTHIELTLHPYVDESERVIVEVTPRIRAAMLDKGVDWSTDALRAKILGRWIKVRGLMLFDEEHRSEATNTAPDPPTKNIWRATCWELHPVTSIQVVKAPKSAAGAFKMRRGAHHS